MTEKTIKLKVIKRSGVWLPGKGSRKYGDHFVVDAPEARDLAKRYPAYFELINDPGEVVKGSAEAKPEAEPAPEKADPPDGKTKVSTKAAKADKAE